MDFDQHIDRRGTHSMKWDLMQNYYGVSPDTGIPMWVADMDFKPPLAVTEALQRDLQQGVLGYFGDETAHHAAIQSWMQKRHHWDVEADWISTTHGLVAATALCVQAFTEVGEGVILFTPVYHAFARIIKANQREVIESPLQLNEAGQYAMDLSGLAAQLRGHEKMLILCSPHNPGGRVWSVAELQAVADFCEAHDLILVADEIHHDLVFAPAAHTVMPMAAPSCQKRLVMLTATTKSFNIAGGMTGNVTIMGDVLRQRFRAALAAAGSSPNRFGVLMATAAYAEGEAWLEALLSYLDANRRLLDETFAQIPGWQSMPMQSTYLAWVNVAGSGMPMPDLLARLQQEAGIAVNFGHTFGQGGEDYLRFNFACPKAQLAQACERLLRVF